MRETGLFGRTAVVLGGSTPWGRVTCKALAEQGINLALGGRSRNELEALREEIEASGGRALVVGTHLAKRHHPAHLVEAAMEEYGTLDILLFMARATAASLDDLNLEAWERSIAVNFKGFMYCLAAALPALMEDEGGCVVVLSVEDSASPPDPFLRASQAAVRTVLEEISEKSFNHRVRAVEVRTNDQLLESPKRCAETIAHALKSLPESSTKLLTYQMQEFGS